MFNDVSSVAARDDVETTIPLVRGVYGHPRSNRRLRGESAAKIEFVLVPGESQTYLRCLPDEEVVYPENVGT